MTAWPNEERGSPPIWEQKQVLRLINAAAHPQSLGTVAPDLVGWQPRRNLPLLEKFIACNQPGRHPGKTSRPRPDPLNPFEFSRLAGKQLSAGIPLHPAPNPVHFRPNQPQPSPKNQCFQYHRRSQLAGLEVDSLAEVRVQEGEPLENALRRFKRKVQQEDIIKEVKRHSYYLKPGEKRRVKAALARKRNRKKARKEQE